MSYITRIKTKTGDKQIDYKSLANLPKEIKIDSGLEKEGQAADSKAVGDASKELKNEINEISQTHEIEIASVDEINNYLGIERI